MQKAMSWLCSLFLMLSGPLSAQGLQQEIEKERETMYRYFSTDSVDQFMAVTDRLKELTQKTGDERLFYRTWGNQALYIFRKVNRSRGLEIAREIREYAEAHDSKYGLYAATSTSTVMMSSLGMLDEAEQGMYEAIGYLHHYFPDEGAAVEYIGLAKIAENRREYRKMIKYAELALKEPNISDIHQVSAKSYICVGYAKLVKTDADREKFNQAYHTFAEASEKMNYDGGLSEIAHYYYCKINGRYAEAMVHARKISSLQNRMPFVAEAYGLAGDYKSAYETYVRYKKYSDSLNSVSVKQQTAEYALQLDLARAENETRELRLANQQLWLAAAGLIVVITLVFLAFYILRRRMQIWRLREAYDKLEGTMIEKERLASELRIAHDIQSGLVTTTFPAFPDRNDIDLHALMLPAREVGGDLYDFYLQNDKLYFCVGDVSGKGVPASMTMMVVINLFRTFVKDGYPPAYIVTRINDTLSIDNENGIFVTLFVGEIDLQSGSMDYCNAGHNPPVIIDMQHPRFMEMETNVPVGLWPEMEFVQEHIGNIKGKSLLVYTDGLTEAENSWQEQFGETQLLEVLRWNRFESARQTIDLLQREVKRHAGEAEPSDDLAMLCIYIKPSYSVMRRELTIKNKVTELRRVAVFVEEIGMELKLDGMELNNLQLVLEEAVSNVIFYAHPEGVEANITLIAESDGQELTFILSDQGNEFDPTLKEDVDIDVNPADRKIGGLGIFIVKNIMNHVTYQRLEGRNLLTMKKKIKR